MKLQPGFGYLNRSVSASITRPNDTTAYAAGDVVASSTTAAVATTFANAVGEPGGSAILTSVMMVDSSSTATKGQFEVWLFNASYTQDQDNAVFTPTDAECATLVAVVPLNTSYVGDATAGTGGNAVYFSGAINQYFSCAAASTTLYGALVVRNAYTPIAVEVFTIQLNLQPA